MDTFCIFGKLLPATVTATPDLPHLCVKPCDNPRWPLWIICFEPGIVLAVLCVSINHLTLLTHPREAEWVNSLPGGTDL